MHGLMLALFILQEYMYLDPVRNHDYIGDLIYSLFRSFQTPTSHIRCV